MSRLAADTKLETLDWIPSPRIAALKRLQIASLSDLLRHFPRRYEDRRKFDRFPDEASDTAICLFGIVKKTAIAALERGEFLKLESKMKMLVS